jgi:two-component system NtrC family sensor kinase
MPGRVVVVADNQEAGNDLIRSVLAPAGYQAVLEDAERPAADLLIVDVTRLRGAPLAGLRVRREAGDTAPAILLAAHLPDDLAGEVLRLQVADFLVKPVRPEALLTAIEALLAVSVTQTQDSDRLAADNAALHRRLEDWRSAVSIGRAVVQIHDLDTLLERIVEAAVYLSEAEEGALYLVEPVTSELVLRASRDSGQAQAKGLRLRAPDGIAAEVLRSGEPALKRAGPGQPGLKVKTGHLVHALINLPLTVGGRPIGVLGVYHRARGRTFSDQQVESLVFLADWAAISVESAQRFSELRARLEQKTEALSRARAAAGSGDARRSRVPVPAAALDELRATLETISVEIGSLLAAAYGPLRPAQADCLARLRKQTRDIQSLVEQLSAGETGRPARLAGEEQKEVRL